MNKNYLLDELKKIQNEYLKLLKAINIDDKLLLSIDAMKVFWYRNKAIIDIALDYLHKPYEGVVFTAGTCLDIDDNDIYPFLLFGDCHIVDDPIFRISRAGLIPNEKRFTDYMLKSSKQIIENTIKLIEKYGDYVFILPIRLFYEINIGHSNIETDKVFLDLFKGKMTMKKYWEIKDINELDNALRKEVKNNLPLFQGDNSELDLGTRLENFKNENELPQQMTKTVNGIFFMAVYSKMGQAIDITRMTIASYVIPFIRDMTSLYYTDVILNHLNGKIENINLIRYRSQLCSLIYKIFDRKIVNGLPLEKFELLRKKSIVTNIWSNTNYSLSMNENIKNIDVMLKILYENIENSN